MTLPFPTLNPGELADLRRRIGDRQLVVSVSGGKDSTAMALYLRHLGFDFQAVFCDTGWEAPETYAYLRDELPEIIGVEPRWLRAEVKVPDPVKAAVAAHYEERLGHPSPMVRLCVQKMIFPSKRVRFCTGILKVEPIAAYLDTLEEDWINAVGIRWEESQRRATYPEWEWADNLDGFVWRPICRFTVDDVIGIHRHFDARPNPLYLQRSERVGCWPCIYARKAEIRFIGEHSPDRVALLADLEADMTELARMAKAKRWEPMKHPRTWFGNPMWRRGQKKDHVPWGIRRVLTWARTKRGGREIELFDAPAGQRGCVRWGYCEPVGGFAGDGWPTDAPAPAAPAPVIEDAGEQIDLFG